jgi:SNF2 family DNA or RNA helicase
MTDRHVSVRLLEGATAVDVSRGSSVPEEFWLQLRADWGSMAAGVSEHLVVPLERFMARRQHFARIAKQNKIRITLDDAVKPLLAQVNQDTNAFQAATTAGFGPISAEELTARLAGGRFKRDLRGFQKDDLRHLLGLSHGANFSVPGAGKTTVAYAAYEAERLAGRVKRMLVIGPLSSFGSWQDEADESFSEPPTIHRFDGGTIPTDAEVVLVNYQRLATGYDHLARWVTAEPTLVILDEAHRMKRGWDGQWGTACLNLAYLAQRRDILSGTPAPQGPNDFVALIDYLWPGQARRILPADALVANPPPDASHRVAKAIKPLFVRTNKADLKLPEMTFNPLIVPLTGLHRDIYQALKNQYAGSLGMKPSTRRDFWEMGRIVMYLLEAATNPKLLTAGSLESSDPDVFRHPPLEIPEGSELAELFLRFPEFGTPEKFKELVKLINTNIERGRKTLVWSNFVRNLKTLERMLNAANPALIHGSVPPYAGPGQPSRETAIEAFRHDEDCWVLLANPAAMSEGISLHRECHDAVYLERTFNAGQYLQSLDRIHRLGLPPDTKTRITFLITDETIDLAIDRRVRSKAKRLGEMLDDSDLESVALPNEEDYGPPVEDEADLAALFEHLRGVDG